MTIMFDPASVAAVAAFASILLMAVSGYICFSKLSNRIDSLASDIQELKTDVKQALGMLQTHQGLGAGVLPPDADST